MKSYKVKVLRNFTDAVTGEKRLYDSSFVCDKERYEFLKKNNAVELIEIIEEAKFEEIKEEKTEEKIKEEIKPVKKQNNKKKSK